MKSTKMNEVTNDSMNMQELSADDLSGVAGGEDGVLGVVLGLAMVGAAFVGYNVATVLASGPSLREIGHY